MIERTLQAVHALLFNTAALTDLVGTNMHYARAPVTSTYPQLIYFDVASRTDAVLDYDKVTVQVSVWSGDKWQALSLQQIAYTLFLRFRGIIDIGGGETVNVNWSEMIDMSALPQDDPQLYGYQIRFELRTKGANIGE